MFDSAIEKLSTDGIKVEATIDNTVYLKLAATVVMAVIVSTIAYFTIRGIFITK